MIQEPTNYHSIGDYTSYKKIFEEGHTFVVFDTETTGLKADEERVIEIGAIKFNKNGIIEKFGTLINPEKTISSQITQITGITNKMVYEKPTSKDVIPKFMSFIKGCILIAHNAPFDLRFINHELIRLNQSTLQNYTIDTLKLTRWAYPTLGQWRQPFLAEHFGIKIESVHRAYDDARVCMEIFLKTINESDKMK